MIFTGENIKQKSYKVKTVNLKPFLFMRSSLLRWASEWSLILQGAPVCPFIHLVKILGLLMGTCNFTFPTILEISLTLAYIILILPAHVNHLMNLLTAILMTFKSSTSQHIVVVQLLSVSDSL